MKSRGMDHGYLRLHWAKAVVRAETLTTETDHRVSDHSRNSDQTCDHMVVTVVIKKYYQHSYPQGEWKGGSLNIVVNSSIAAARKVLIT